MEVEMNSEDIGNIIVLLLFLLVVIMAGLSFVPPEEIIANGTVIGLHNDGLYYTYDLKANDKIIQGVISTNYYELESEHTVYFKQNIIGITAFGKFV